MAVQAGAGPAIPPGTQVLYEPAGREKMSEVLEDFVEPYRDLADTDDAFRKLLNLGMLAWNAALMPEDQRRAMIDEMLAAGLSRSPRRIRPRPEISRRWSGGSRSIRGEPAGDRLLRVDGQGRRLSPLRGVHPLSHGPGGGRTHTGSSCLGCLQS